MHAFQDIFCKKGSRFLFAKVDVISIVASSTRGMLMIIQGKFSNFSHQYRFLMQKLISIAEKITTQNSRGITLSVLLYPEE